MKKKSKSGVTRRNFLPLLSGLFLPLSVFGKTKPVTVQQADVSYQTMLTKDGKIVNKQLSNQSLLSWLKKSDKDV